MIDLDANATTRPADEVVEAVAMALREGWHNPSSLHRAGQAARRVVELARRDVAALLGVKPGTITFTSGGSESNACVLRTALAGGSRSGERPVIVTSPIEHASILETLDRMERAGACEVRLCEVDDEGVVRPESVRAVLDERVRLVSVQWVNAETGAIQGVGELGAICRGAREGGVAPRLLFHTDATQWVGRMPTDLNAMADGPDLLTCSPHKFHAPKGVGVLYGAPGVRVEGLVPGAQERGTRGGTENVPGIAGAGAAAALARAWLGDDSAREHLAGLRDRLEAGLVGLRQGACVNGPRAPGARVWTTSSVSFGAGVSAETLLLALSERGVCASAGSACASGSTEPSHVLRAMGLPPDRARSTLRFSLSRLSTPSEVDDAIEIVGEVLRTMG